MHAAVGAGSHCRAGRKALGGVLAQAIALSRRMFSRTSGDQATSNSSVRALTSLALQPAGVAEREALRKEHDETPCSQRYAGHRRRIHKPPRHRCAAAVANASDMSAEGVLLRYAIVQGGGRHGQREAVPAKTAMQAWPSP